MVELIIVISIITILVAIAAPIYRNSVIRSKEAVLRDDLFTMRQVMEQYTVDRHKAPLSLDDLVAGNYLRELPKDPFTNSNTTWRVEMEDPTNAADPNNPGILNVRSGSDQTALDGTAYSTW
jgi:general secretion pathway protein G